MTTPSEDEPEPPIVEQTCLRAQQIIKQVASLLQMDGWDSVVISLTRAVEAANGSYYAPGATATIVDKDLAGPIIPQIVQVLRKQADMLEAQWGRDVAGDGYIQDATVYSSGCAEWPR
jgi:hypothetical protein